MRSYKWVLQKEEKGEGEREWKGEKEKSRKRRNIGMDIETIQDM